MRKNLLRVKAFPIAIFFFLFCIQLPFHSFSQSVLQNWTQRFSGGQATAIATDGSGNVIVTGYGAGAETKNLTVIRN